MDIQSRLELIRQVGEEIITEAELKHLLETKKRPVAYDGFEPSGTDIHIAQGLLRAINVNKMTKAGCLFKMYAADWHAWANNKLGGDLEKIQACGDYIVEVWKSCGMDLDNVQFVRASEVVDSMDYWKKVLQISRAATISRVIRTGQIMGRKDAEVQQSSQILYSCMQAADIYELEADITQLGMDQRKVNMLARELAPKLGWYKPVVVSHHMLLGLQNAASSEKNAVDRAIDMKMSKSKPDSAIFMTDSEEDVIRKIKKAHCPEKVALENPVLEYARYIVFETAQQFEITRPEKFGGSVSYESYAQLEKAYTKGDIHPLDLKNSVAQHLNTLLEPVRSHFEKNARARKLRERVQSFEITR